MSSPSEPVGIVSISTAFWFLPRRMIEPLPNARSICASAASSALVLSTKVPSTTRRLGWLTTLLLLSRSALSRQPSPRRPPVALKGTPFVLVRKFFFCSPRNNVKAELFPPADKDGEEARSDYAPYFLCNIGFARAI